mgnify:CR=1 FL=1
MKKEFTRIKKMFSLKDLHGMAISIMNLSAVELPFGTTKYRIAMVLQQLKPIYTTIEKMRMQLIDQHNPYVDEQKIKRIDPMLQGAFTKKWEEFLATEQEIDVIALDLRVLFPSVLGMSADMTNLLPILDPKYLEWLETDEAIKLEEKYFKDLSDKTKENKDKKEEK